MRFALALLLAAPVVAQPTPSPYAPWGDAALVGVGAASGLVGGAVLGQVLPVGDAGWMAASAGTVGGMVGGTYAAQRLVGLRPDLLGALVGAGLGGLVGVWVMSQGPEGRSMLWGVGGVMAGAALGHRYLYIPRTSVSVVPVATPQGQGVYAVVRF